MNHHITRTALCLGMVLTLSLPGKLQAGGDGSNGYFGSTSRTNWDLVEDFMYSYLLGPRIEPYWDGDRADIPALDERIYQLEVLFGYDGLPLTALREDLDFGLSRGGYQLGAMFAIKEIAETQRNNPDAPKAYRGYIGDAEIASIMKWHADGWVSGLYHHSPARGDLRTYYIRGHNREYGRLYLLESHDRTRTQSARLYLEKDLFDDQIVWSGVHHASSGRKEPALFARWRD